VLLDALRASDAAARYVLLDADPGRTGAELDGAPIVGTDARLPELAREDSVRFVVGVGGAGDNRVRRQLFEHAQSTGIAPLTVRHPSATISAAAVVAEGSQLLAGSIVNPGAAVGVNVIVNTGAIVEHDCEIAAHAHIATGARLCGGVRVGEGAHVGAGATVKQGLRIGEWALVGVGAAVIHDVAAGAVVGGVPARVIHTVED
jgi:UDP-perosamine 4-acetyltransferase